jgi:hypothetical protein
MSQRRYSPANQRDRRAAQLAQPGNDPNQGTMIAPPLFSTPKKERLHGRSSLAYPLGRHCLHDGSSISPRFAIEPTFDFLSHGREAGLPAHRPSSCFTAYRRAANDVGEGTDFRLVSLRILPGPHRHKTPQPSTGLSSAPGASFFLRMISSPHGRVAGRCHSQIQNRLNDAAKLNECLATTR